MQDSSTQKYHSVSELKFGCVVCRLSLVSSLLGPHNDLTMEDELDQLAPDRGNDVWIRQFGGVRKGMEWGLWGWTTRE